MLLTASACVSRVVPPALRPTVNRSVAFEELVRDPGRYKGERVVLGGILLASRNLKEGTELEILQKPLSRTDEPRDVDASAGRFIARYPGYLETTVYAKDRRVTVLGKVEGRLERPIGEIVYSYPLIGIEKIHLWPVLEESPYPYYPYWYDPFFYSLGSYGYPYGYPYYPHYPYWP